jgi:hypothetical protein
MKPPVSEPEVKARTEAVFQTFGSRFQEEMRIRQEMDYVQCEEGTLEEAIRHARKHPGQEREVWEWMSNAFEMLNAMLKERGLPPMYYVGYQKFLRLLRTAS